MKRCILKLLIAATAATIALNSCEKEKNDIILNPQKNNHCVITEGYHNQPVIIHGKTMEWTLPIHRPQKKLTKGMIINATDFYHEYISEMKEKYGENYKPFDTINFTYNNKKYEIKLLRVDRKSEPGKYFYVMIDNLDIKLDTACWVYADDENNAKKYGRLYTWPAAHALAQKIKMNLPVYYANNPTQKKHKIPLPATARLINSRDVCDIIENNAIGNLPENGFTIEKHIESLAESDLPMFYYDIFIGGLEGPSGDMAYDESIGQHTMGGWRNTAYSANTSYYINGWYLDLNERAFIWLDDDDCCPQWYHTPLEIELTNGFNYSAFINAGHSNKYGFSVRYVFEPFYKD